MMFNSKRSFKTMRAHAEMFIHENNIQRKY